MNGTFQDTVKKMADMLLERSSLYDSGHIYWERNAYKANERFVAGARNDKFAREIPYDLTPGSPWEVVGDGTIDGSWVALKPRDEEGVA